MPRKDMPWDKQIELREQITWYFNKYGTPVNDSLVTRLLEAMCQVHRKGRNSAFPASKRAKVDAELTAAFADFKRDLCVNLRNDLLGLADRLYSGLGLRDPNRH